MTVLDLARSCLIRGFMFLLVLGLAGVGGYAVGDSRPGRESRETLFAAFRQAVRGLDPEAILELCDDETVKIGLVFVSDVDPRTIPEYVMIPGLPEHIITIRGLDRLTVLDKIPPGITDPRQRLLAALKIRMQNAGEDFCRNFEGFIGEQQPLISIPDLEGYEVFTFEDLHPCEGCARKGFPVVQKNGRWYIGYFGAMVFGAMVDRTIERMSP